MVLRVGLTGGIGSGKSSVARLLTSRGAVVVDADRIARDVVGVGTLGLAQVADRFGPEVLGADGSLDRPALAAVIFADTAARRDLEAITHPLIGARTVELIEAAGSGVIVVHDQPLLIEMGLAPTNHLTVVVGASEETRVDRIVRDRGMSERDARARIEAQTDDATRRAVADAWIDNDGTQGQLARQVVALWDERLHPYDANLRQDRRVKRDTSTPLVLHEHDLEWSVRAARIIGRLERQLDLARLPYAGIDHVGSTAVPGLIAKDVIDLQLRIPLLDQPRAGVLQQVLRAAGVVGLQQLQDHPHSWAPEPALWRKLYAGGADPAVVLHLHIREQGSPGAEAALCFRDWLRAEPVVRAEYAEMKRTMAQQFSSEDYPEAKEPWFALAFPRARQWGRSTGWTAP